MFGEQFYPTPPSVIRKMLAPYEKNGSQYYGWTLPKHILEPSAGKGDIIEYICEKTDYNKPKFYALEIDHNLQEILKNKSNTRLIGEDFLNYTCTDILFEMILMNPPFANGDEHLLHAWNILYAGDIVCLLNTETIENPYSETRKLLAHIIKEHGSVENLGNCFSQAERKTEVNVSIVRLTKVAKRSLFDFSFENEEAAFTSNDLNEESISGIQVHDIIESIVGQYENIKCAYQDWMKACQRLEYHANGIVDSHTNIIKIANDAGFKGIDSFNAFVDDIKTASWTFALSKSGIEKFMTERVRNNFQKFISQQAQMSFTKENIYKVIYDIINNSSMILEQALEDAFDLMTKHYPENRNHVEGWKTNDSWKVNRKVIFPYIIKYGQYSSSHDLSVYGDKFSINYQMKGSLKDIDKCMCYLTGQDMENIFSICYALDRKFEFLGKVKTSDKFDNTLESTFFNIKFFKKGTMHIEFKDAKLWEQFNIRATKHKNWLPPKEYDDWKRKQNGEDIPKKQKHSGLLEIGEQQTLF